MATGFCSATLRKLDDGHLRLELVGMLPREPDDEFTVLGETLEGPFTLLKCMNGGTHRGRIDTQEISVGQYISGLHVPDRGEALFTALVSGAIDAGEAGTAGGLRPDILSPVQHDKRFGMINQKGNFTTALYWNIRQGGALADVRFRRACAMAIDRAELVKRLAGGFGQPGNPGFLSPANEYYTAVPQYGHDVAGANSLLDAAGYRGGANGQRQGPVVRSPSRCS